MGEVYRADDLKLGQTVALKFLPSTLESDPVRLAQFHSEVRLARQVAHKNVCRMYDVGEVDGLPFLTMEYVDGEDLASLLRRIGRLPEDKALDLARQLCAGLAAAHERGILHRDLKPANVMIDGEGQVRITDFGLAAIAGAAGQSRAGTPAYMAPELLAGGDATVQSDVYALGLVLYELFTGRRAYSAGSIGELVRQQTESSPASPSTVVKDLDPAIERTILRALDRDPVKRPLSALAVAASLPGGDPLAAALAAGETPSPEMVAAAGERDGIARPYAIAGHCWRRRPHPAGGSRFRREADVEPCRPRQAPAVLLDRAQQVLEAAGYPARVANNWWDFSLDEDLIAYSLSHPEVMAGRDVFTSRPGALRFYQRTSPRVLAPLSQVSDITASDPPMDVSGMTQVVLDSGGRLMTFHAIPPQKDSSAGTPFTDWAGLFQLAGLDLSRFHQVTPEWLPRGQSDTRAAWEGDIPDGPPQVRVEAAAWHGRPIILPGDLAVDAPRSDGGSADRPRRPPPQRDRRRRDGLPPRRRASRREGQRSRRPRRLEGRLAAGGGRRHRTADHMGVQRSACRQPQPRGESSLLVDRRVAVCRRPAVRDVSRRGAGGPPLLAGRAPRAGRACCRGVSSMPGSAATC